jgi:exopolysaccharide production protein ExoQ
MSGVAGSDRTATQTVAFDTSDLLLVAIITVAAVSPFPGSGELLVALGAATILTGGPESRSVRAHPAVGAFAAWCVASMSWSDATFLTIRSLAIFATVSIAVSSTVWRVGWWRAARALGISMKVLLVASLATYVLLPDLARAQGVYQTGALEGPFIQRNLAAYFAVAACLTFLIFAAAERPRPMGDRALVWAAVAGMVVVLTRSGTGIAVCVSSGLLALLFVWMRRLSASLRKAMTFLVVSSGAGAMWWAAGNVGTLTTLLGRDDTLTGRTVIWEVAGVVIAQAPWTGYGFGALWASGIPVTEAMWAAGGFRFFHAHNTYLDLLLQVGVPGLVLGLLLLAGLFWRSVRHFVTRGGPLGVWGLTMTSFLALYGLTEQSFLSHFGWTLLILALAMTRPTKGAGDVSADRVVSAVPVGSRARAPRGRTPHRRSSTVVAGQQRTAGQHGVGPSGPARRTEARTPAVPFRPRALGVADGRADFIG